MPSMLKHDNCIRFLVAAHLCNTEALKTTSLNILVKNKLTVKETEAWKDLKKEYPGLVAEIYEKLMGE
jgi:hypothetical protein